jgi:hypothetical protein
MAAVSKDLAIEQGVTWAAAWHVKLDGEDLDPEAGWQARAQVRKNAAGSVLHEFTCSVVGSVVQVSVTAAESSAWSWRRGVYDVELFSVDGRVIRVVQGAVSVSPEVTR